MINSATQFPHLEQSQKILSLGPNDLIAMEAQYHNSCQRAFIRETKTAPIDEELSSRRAHGIAFQNLSDFIEKEIMNARKPKVAENIMQLYKVEYVSIGGEVEDLETYTQQSHMKKLGTNLEKR